MCAEECGARIISVSDSIRPISGCANFAIRAPNKEGPPADRLYGGGEGSLQSGSMTPEIRYWLNVNPSSVYHRLPFAYTQTTTLKMLCHCRSTSGSATGIAPVVFCAKFTQNTHKHLHRQSFHMHCGRNGASSSWQQHQPNHLDFSDSEKSGITHDVFIKNYWPL